MKTGQGLEQANRAPQVQTQKKHSPVKCHLCYFLFSCSKTEYIRGTEVYLAYGSGGWHLLKVFSLLHSIAEGSTWRDLPSKPKELVSISKLLP